MKLLKKVCLISSILVLLCNLSQVYAEPADVESLKNNASYYQYSNGSSRLNYKISPSETTYYLYDSNGNTTKKISSKKPPMFTSSEYSGFEAYRLGDSSSSTFWSSNGHPVETGQEWVATDLGENHIISGISLTPRSTLGFPKDFKIQFSDNAVTWSDVPHQSYTNYVNNGSVQSFKFDSSVVARYVRVYATKLGKDDMGNYYFQLSEFNADLSNIAASSSLQGWSVNRLTDNNTSTLWSTPAHGSESATEWIAFDLGNMETVGSISLTPRGTYSFPKDFKIQTSNDALTWSDVPNQSYTNYVNNGSVQTFTFESSVLAKYIRVHATKLSKDDMGSYYFQLAEFKANITNVAASSSLIDWPASRLSDNNTATSWSSVAHSNESNTEWVILNLGSTKSLSGITLSPRATLSFPKDFSIQASNNAIVWTDIPNQSYANYVNNGSAKNFNFTTPVSAKFIRIYATKLNVDDRGSYYFQLNEIKATLSSLKL
ncbi:discoidin domain-containing protein [Paenibacillus sp. sgz500992]|uniref:discoidin domain-containing protein n=1 Tax=Paenibacillus sp. sgz500992 TaxID=3242476 RepID=UPI0036D3650D